MKPAAFRNGLCIRDQRLALVGQPRAYRRACKYLRDSDRDNPPTDPHRVSRANLPTMVPTVTRCPDAGLSPITSGSWLIRSNGSIVSSISLSYCVRIPHSLRYFSPPLARPRRSRSHPDPPHSPHTVRCRPRHRRVPNDERRQDLREIRSIAVPAVTSRRYTHPRQIVHRVRRPRQIHRSAPGHPTTAATSAEPPVENTSFRVCLRSSMAACNLPERAGLISTSTSLTRISMQ